MTCIPLGKISVPTPGTPVLVTPTPQQVGELPPPDMVYKVEVWPDTANAGVIKVFVNGTQVAALPVPNNGHAEAYQIASPEDTNAVSPASFSIDAAVSGDGGFVTLWVS